MPIYPYRCRDCREVTELFAKLADRPDSVTCEHCGKRDTYQVIGRTAYHADVITRTAKLDPKYDKMIDHSMSKSINADEHRLMKRGMKPYSEGT